MWPLHTLRQFHRRYHLRNYVRGLPICMLKTYGAKDSYSGEEVDKVISKFGYSPKYSYFGHALLTAPHEYSVNSSTQSWPQQREVLDLVSTRYFGGKAFNRENLFSLSFVESEDWSDYVSRDRPPPSWQRSFMSFLDDE